MQMIVTGGAGFPGQRFIFFHLAAVVTSQAEKGLDSGWKVNLPRTRQLPEACRHQEPDIRFVFASSLAVHGGKFSAVVDATTALTPQSSYTSSTKQKAG
jgi:D-erythronate 2-dehydrogenase